MHPPHQSQPNDFGRKITLNFGEDLFFFFLETTWFWAKKTFKFEISAENSVSKSAKTFFFFGDHLILGEKTFEFEISAENSVSKSGKTSEFLRFCA